MLGHRDTLADRVPKILRKLHKPQECEIIGERNRPDAYTHAYVLQV